MNDKHRDFIEKQHIFFNASSCPGSRVNLSPRPADCLRIIDANTVCYLDRTGSGNETAAHARHGGSVTLMFCSFSGPPNILRLFGKAEFLYRGSVGYMDILNARYGGEEPLGARQIAVINIDLVQTSCGFGVPLFDFQEHRPSLDNWSGKQIEEGGPDIFEKLHRQNNSTSIDGLPTGIGQ